jgi:hypothetical protein
VTDDDEDVFFLLRCRCGALLASVGDEGITAAEAREAGWDPDESRCPKCRETAR